MPLVPRDRLRDQLDRGSEIVVVSDGSAQMGGVYGSGKQSSTEEDRMSCGWVFGVALTGQVEVEGSEVGVDVKVQLRDTIENSERADTFSRSSKLEYNNGGRLGERGASNGGCEAT